MSEVTVIKVSETYMQIKAPLGQNDNFNRLNKMTGYHRWKGRNLQFRPVASSIDYIYENWPEAHWEGDAANVLQSHLSDVHVALEANARKGQTLVDTGDFKFKTTPYDHQLQAFLVSRDMPNFALLMEMGTGKTKILIDNAAYLYSKGEIDCLVVLAPNGVHRNWIDIEIPVHLPNWVPHSSDFYSSKHGKKRSDRMYDSLRAKDCLKIIAINIEGFASPKAKSLLEMVVGNFKCLVVLDESTTIKNPSSIRSKFLTNCCKDVPYKRIANGAPITKGIEDLYSQFGFLSHNIIGYDSYTAFKRQYCELMEWKQDKHDPNSRTLSKIVSYKNTDHLIDRIAPYSMRVTKSECLDLPEKIYKLWPVHLSDEQKKAYVELKNEFITEIDGATVSAEVSLVRLMRLQQIASGWYPDEEGELLHPFKNNPRLEALKEICSEVEENKEKAIIWARFKKDIYEIEKVLGDKAVSYHGDIDEEGRIDSVNRFKNDDSVRYMIAMLSSNSGAVRGHTWTAASVTIYYSNIFDLDPRQQSEDRMHRIGMGDKALYIDLMAVGTIDRKIISALRDKKAIADIITQDGPSSFLQFINE